MGTTRKLLHHALTLAAAVAAPLGMAQAQDAKATPQWRSLAANCAQCHGTAGRPPPTSIMPVLAGQPEAYLVEQMTAFKSGARPGTVMPQIAKGYNDAQIRQLAAYFAAQAR